MVRTVLLSLWALLIMAIGFPTRDGAVHKARCFEHHALLTEKEKDEFFKKHGSRWTKFARLKYFDLLRYTIIDPMHSWLQGTRFLSIYKNGIVNCLLGMAKLQWYTMFIKRKVLRP